MVDRPAARVARKTSAVEAKLVCRAGPSTGEEFPLTGGTQVIGRAADVEISIPDTSVSRRHLKVFKRTADWYVADLGSGNGTVLNGERIEAESVVRHGDVLTLGDTELSFVDLANMTDKAPIPVQRASKVGGSGPRPASRSGARPRGSRYRQSITEKPRAVRTFFNRLFVLVIMGAMVGGLIYFKKLADIKDAKEKAQRLKDGQRSQQLAEVFQEADKLAADGDWRSAQEKYKQVAAKDPTYGDIQARLERAEKELPNQAALEEAKAQLAKGHLLAAAQALKKMTPDTLMFKQQGEVQQGLNAKVLEEVEAARKALDANQLKEAERLAEEVLSIVPDNRDAISLREQAQGMGRRPGGPKETKSPWGDVVRHFVAGDLREAQASAKACAPKVARCKTLVLELNEFAELHKHASTLEGKQLSKFKELARDISDGRGTKLTESADAKEATALLQKATVAKSQGELGKAAKLALEASLADPSLAAAKALLSDLRSQAKDVFIAGYAVKDSDPAEAIKHFKDVLNMTAPGDEYHQKAEKWIEKLRQ